MTPTRALICGVLAMLGIAFVLWMAQGLPREQERFERDMFNNCASAHMRGGVSKSTGEIQCAYITDMERLGK